MTATARAAYRGAVAEELDDLALAAACARGDAAAIGELERRFANVFRGVTQRFARDASHGDELRQLLRARLFAGSPPRIADYRGVGHLENWLRVTALRVCMNAVRGKDPARPGASTGGLSDVVDRGDDVELQFLKAQYRHAFRAAFAAAVAALAPGETAVLRLALVEQLSIDEIGAALGLHRATAARRVAKAKARLVELVVGGLKAALAIDDAELASLQRGIDGQVEVSLSRLFARTTDEASGA